MFLNNIVELDILLLPLLNSLLNGLVVLFPIALHILVDVSEVDLQELCQPTRVSLHVAEGSIDFHHQSLS